MRSYSKKRMYDSGIYPCDYKTNEREGVFLARLDYKRWGNNHNILAYFTFEDGRKVFASAWNNTGYLGIPEIETGEMLMLTFKKAKSGTSYLKKVERCDAGNARLTP